MRQVTENPGRAPTWVPILEIQFVAIALFKQTLACLMWIFPSLQHPWRFFGNTRVASVFSLHKPLSSTSTSADLSRNFHHQGYYYHPLSGKDIGDISHTGTVSLLSTAEASSSLSSKIGWPVHSPGAPCHMPTSSKPAQDFCFIYINLWMMFPQQAVNNNLSTIRLLY